VNEDFLQRKLNERKEQNAFRTVRLSWDKIDFCSNDYLGISKNNLLQSYLIPYTKHGSTGSRLLTGNYALIEETEKFIATFHDAQSGLIFNSGYDANIGLLSCVPQKGDIIIYDKLSHASIRDGIRLSFAESFSFLHNDLHDLEKKLESVSIANRKNIFVVTESVFSMDGDIAPLEEIVTICEKYKANTIVDEAHATGVTGNKGEGLVQLLHLQKKCFARVHTFGKACGVHGAIVLGSHDLRDYLVNLARPFIYSTALPEASIAAVNASYHIFPRLNSERKHLTQLIQHFQHAICDIQYSILNIQHTTLNIQHSETPIQVVIIPGNEQVKIIAEKLQQNNLDVRAILYPSVPKGSERLRIVLHAFNSIEEINTLLTALCR
jgi:8-amino-7-oxononanoate synthase